MLWSLASTCVHWQLQHITRPNHKSHPNKHIHNQQDNMLPARVPPHGTGPWWDSNRWSVCASHSPALSKTVHKKECNTFVVAVVPCHSASKALSQLSCKQQEMLSCLRVLVRPLQLLDNHLQWARCPWRSLGQHQPQPDLWNQKKITRLVPFNKQRQQSKLFHMCKQQANINWSLIGSQRLHMHIPIVLKKGTQTACNLLTLGDFKGLHIKNPCNTLHHCWYRASCAVRGLRFKSWWDDYFSTYTTIPTGEAGSLAPSVRSGMLSSGTGGGTGGTVPPIYFRKHTRSSSAPFAPLFAPFSTQQNQQQNNNNKKSNMAKTKTTTQQQCWQGRKAFDKENNNTTGGFFFTLAGGEFILFTYESIGSDKLNNSSCVRDVSGRVAIKVF